MRNQNVSDTDRDSGLVFYSQLSVFFFFFFFFFPLCLVLYVSTLLLRPGASLIVRRRKRRSKTVKGSYCIFQTRKKMENTLQVKQNTHTHTHTHTHNRGGNAKCLFKRALLDCLWIFTQHLDWKETPCHTWSLHPVLSREITLLLLQHFWTFDNKHLVVKSHLQQTLAESSQPTWILDLNTKNKSVQPCVTLDTRGYQRDKSDSDLLIHWFW